MNYVNLEAPHEAHLFLNIQKNMNSHINEQQKRIKVKYYAILITQKENTDHMRFLQRIKACQKSMGTKHVKIVLYYKIIIGIEIKCKN